MSIPFSDRVGPEVVALGGVVVDDVEDDLEAGGVERLDHRLELVDLPPPVAGRAVVAVRGQEADAVVAPVVAQASLEQVGVVHELVHRQQLDGGDAEVGQVAGDCRVGQPGVGAPELFGHVGVALGEALDVGLVDDRLVERDVGGGRRRPVEVAVGDDALRASTGAESASLRSSGSSKRWPKTASPQRTSPSMAVA